LESPRSKIPFIPKGKSPLSEFPSFQDSSPYLWTNKLEAHDSASVINKINNEEGDPCRGKPKEFFIYKYD